MKTLGRGILVFLMFVVVFFLTTAIFDTIERRSGYYDKAIKESNEVGKYNVFLQD